VRRGEVWDAILPEPAGPRPVLILSHDSMPAARPEITVAYLTTRRRYSRAEVPPTAAGDGVERDCVVNLDSINTVSKDFLVGRVCKLSAARMQEVADAIRFALNLP